MSRVTGKEVENYLLDELSKSALAEDITGRVYRRGARPRGSKLEDIEVSYTAGTSDEISEGFVTVNIFVRDVNPWVNAVYVENGDRLTKLEELAGEWVDGLPVYPYRFELRNAIYTMEAAETHEHFVAIHLRYEIYEPK